MSVGLASVRFSANGRRMSWRGNGVGSSGGSGEDDGGGGSDDDGMVLLVKMGNDYGGIDETMHGFERRW